MRIYIIGNDGITLCREAPATTARAARPGDCARRSRQLVRQTTRQRLEWAYAAGSVSSRRFQVSERDGLCGRNRYLSGR